MVGGSGEEPSKGIDPTPGGLVWIRRRNGAWWPGMILGPDELPEGCVPTPKAGTPVKLLGREDASVDWYNLEKSKRVKAFHCKEYKECIKRVKESASHSSKRGVKYARREDAILHALELENARLGKDRTGPSAAPDARDHCHVDDSPSACSEDDDSGEDDSGSGPEVSQSGVSFVGLDLNEPENESEDDGSEGVKRMRGLEDLGMGVASPLRRKRAQVGPVHEPLKRKNRHRPLTKVMECATMVSVPVISDRPSVPSESNESKRNSSVLINNNSDSNGVSSENGTLSRHASDASLKHRQKDSETFSKPENRTVVKLFGVPLVPVENNSAGWNSIAFDASKRTLVAGGAESSQSGHVEAMSLGNEEYSEDGSARSAPFGWRVKGKRNSRSRKVEPVIEAEPPYVTGVGRGRFLANVGPKNLGGPLSESGGFRIKLRQMTAEPLVPPRLLPYRQSRLTVNPKYDDSEYSLVHRTTKPGLYDVNIEVKASYRPQHVPYISLMSKSTNRPVVGHPLQVEVLRDGSSDKYENGDVFASGSGRKRRGRPPSKRGRKLKLRRNGVSSKKTRKLSALTGSHRREEAKPLVEKLKGPSVACVPVKLVFSRINEALAGSGRSGARL